MTTRGQKRMRVLTKECVGLLLLLSTSLTCPLKSLCLHIFHRFWEGNQAPWHSETAPLCVPFSTEVLEDERLYERRIGRSFYWGSCLTHGLGLLLSDRL